MKNNKNNNNVFCFAKLPECKACETVQRKGVFCFVSSCLHLFSLEVLSLAASAIAKSSGVGLLLRLCCSSAVMFLKLIETAQDHLSVLAIRRRGL